MSRLIDAEGSELQAHLKFIREAEYQIYGRGSWGFTAKCEHAIEDAPTVSQWIPVSERLRYGYVHLPSEEEDVLICFKYADEYRYDVATFYRDDDPIDGGEVFESESRVYELDEVLAWMPLPEPYRTEG